MANEARHAAARGLKREVVKRKEKGGWAEDERASPCQMKHRTQLSPAAGVRHILRAGSPLPYMHQVLPMRSASFAENAQNLILGPNLPGFLPLKIYDDFSN